MLHEGGSELEEVLVDIDVISCRIQVASADARVIMHGTVLNLHITFIITIIRWLLEHSVVVVSPVIPAVMGEQHVVENAACQEDVVDVLLATEQIGDTQNLTLKLHTMAYCTDLESLLQDAECTLS